MEFVIAGIALVALTIQHARHKSREDRLRHDLGLERRRRYDVQGERLSLQLGDTDSEPKTLLGRLPAGVETTTEAQAWSEPNE